MENKPNFYAIIPANVRYDKDLTPNAKLLYGEITALCNKKGFCYANNRYFSDLYGKSKTSISKWVSSLVKKGYISIELVYKPSGKEILHRYIRLLTHPIEEKLNPYVRKVKYPIEEKLKDNTTVNNNTYYINKTDLKKSEKLVLSSKKENPYAVEKEKSSAKKEKEVIEWNNLLLYFNEVTGKNKRIVSNKVKISLKARLKEGYNKEDIINTINNSFKDEYHKETNHKYITLEYISRSDVIDRFLDVKNDSEKIILGMKT